MITEVTVETRGPLFSPVIERALTDAMLADCRQEVANQALADVHLIMDRSFRNPTPYYETQVTVERRGEVDVVHDRGIIYGPWLEGVGSRNATTRFKGYAMFRRATQETARKVSALCQPVVDRYVGRLG